MAERVPSLEFFLISGIVFGLKEISMSIQFLKDVVEDKVVRFSSTWVEMDWLYNGGIPRGGISLWAGAPGVGKTRISVELLKRLDTAGLKTLIFQGELSLGRFKSFQMRDYRSNNIMVSDDTFIEEQIAAIEKYRPDLVISDSVQQIEEYEGGRGAKNIVRRLREVIKRTRSHVIFLSQTTLEGHAKGGTQLPHEVDFVAELSPLPESMVQMSVPNKNRFGSSGRSIFFAHEDWGVECRKERLGGKVITPVTFRSSLGKRMGKVLLKMFSASAIIIFVLTMG